MYVVVSGCIRNRHFQPTFSLLNMNESWVSLFRVVLDHRILFQFKLNLKYFTCILYQVKTTLMSSVSVHDDISKL